MSAKVTTKKHYGQTQILINGQVMQGLWRTSGRAGAYYESDTFSTMYPTVAAAKADTLKKYNQGYWTRKNPRGGRAVKKKMATARKLAKKSFRVRVGKKRGGCRKVGRRRYCSIGIPSGSKKYIGIARASRHRRKVANPKRPKARRKSRRQSDRGSSRLG